MNSLFYILISSFLINISSYSQTIRFVKPVSSGLADGSSWSNASSNLQMIINASAINDEVWVSGGTYKPNSDYIGNANPTDPRTKTFVMKEGVKIYGSFNGSEMSLSERTTEVMKANVSILSGDLLGDDLLSGFGSTLNISNNSENCYHVFFNYNFPKGRLPLTPSTLLNGFTITGGNANNQFSSPPHNKGGGIYNYACSPRIINVNFIGNNAYHSGGGMSNEEYSTPSIEGVDFIQNVGGGGGGGMKNYYSSPFLNNVQFLGNRAGSGGGLSNDNNSSPIMKNVIIKLNNATLTGGGIENRQNSNPVISNTFFSLNTAFNGGGMSNSYTSPKIINTLFSENSSSNTGGALYNEGYSTSELTNCTFYLNLGKSGGAIYNSGVPNSIIKNCIFWKNKKNGNENAQGADIQTVSSLAIATIVTNSLLQLNNSISNYPATFFIFDNKSIFKINPLFFNELDIDGLDNVLGTTDDGLILKPCSPVINFGDNSVLELEDILGNNRISDGIVDIGPYETQLLNPLNLFLSNPRDNVISNIGILQAIRSVVATNVIEQSGNVTIQSGGSINLNAGFEAKMGAIFKVEIVGCN